MKILLLVLAVGLNGCSFKVGYTRMDSERICYPCFTVGNEYTFGLFSYWDGNFPNIYVMEKDRR